jgi:hypothetical protein
MPGTDFKPKDWTSKRRLPEEFYPAAPYDVVVLSNVLEHTLDPRQMLLDVHRILASGGKVCISCPNSESWLRRAFGSSWINWHVPFHISHFCYKTLCQLLAQTGFTPIEMRQVTPAVWVAQSLIAYMFAREGTKNQQLRNPPGSDFLCCLPGSFSFQRCGLETGGAGGIAC